MCKKHFFKMIYILSLLMILNSCVVSRYIKKNFIGCYDGTPTGIDTLLDLSGYFLKSPNFSDKNGSCLSGCQFLVFYNDGMVFRGEWTSLFGNCNTFIQRHFYKAYPDRLNGVEWGLYKLTNNIIKVQFVEPGSPGSQGYSSIVRYKVIDRHTIQEVIGFDLEGRPSNIEVVDIYRFVPIDKLPPSDCWLKSKKWFWCNEEMYMKYKQNLKNEKI